MKWYHKPFFAVHDLMFVFLMFTWFDAYSFWDDIFQKRGHNNPKHCGNCLNPQRFGLLCPLFGQIISSQKESAMILREHSDTNLRTIRIRSCDGIINFNKKSSQIFVIIFAHFTTGLRAAFLPEITCLLRKSHEWFLEQLLWFFGRHRGRNLCSENTFLHNMFPLRGYTSAKWSRQRYNYGSNNKKNNCNVTQQSPHLTSDCVGLWAITTPGSLVPLR